MLSYRELLLGVAGRMTGRDGDVFDYVIVGAGTAGCVLASRLSEDPSNRVVLIEAGPLDSHPLIHIPATVGAAIAVPRLNWRFKAAAPAHLNGRSIPIPRRHVLRGLRLHQWHGLL